MQFLFGVFDLVFGLQGETDKQLVIAFCLADGGEDVFGLDQLNSQILFPFLDFFGSDVRGRVIGHGSGHDDNVLLVSQFRALTVHLLGGLHIVTLDVVMPRGALGGTGH